MSHSSAEPIDPNSLPIEIAARMLSKAGARQITEQMIQKDIQRGAPTNPDGTINLVHYAAWNVKRMDGDSNDG